MQKQCRICNKKHKLNLKGILSYPKHLLFGTIPNYFRRVTQKLNEKQTQQVSLSDTHICYIINQDICGECWTFMYQGFQCQKCNTYNYHCTQEIKICFLCNVVYCQNCFRRVDLFSQNGLCTFCQFHQSQSANSMRQLLSLFFAFMFPCLAFKYLVSKLVKTFETIQYTQSQKIICVSSFVIMFPLIYCICLIGFAIMLIAKVIKSIILLLKKNYIQKRVAE